MTTQVDCLEGFVDRLLFANADGYTVARLVTSDTRSHVAVGTCLRGTQPGESVRVHGRWESHRHHGLRFVAAECERIEPAGAHAIRCFLGSGLIRGIGTTLAHAIVDTFGEETLRIIDTAPERLLDVHNIGPSRLRSVVDAWATHKAVHEVMVFLHGLGASPALAVRIHHAFGDDAIKVVQSDPYRLVEEVRGIGFLTADQIAMAVGIPEHSPPRLRAGVLHVLESAEAQRGDCFQPEQHLLDRAAKLLDQPDTTLLRPVLDELRTQGKVVIEVLPQLAGDGVAVFSARLHRAETSLSRDLARILTAPSQMPVRAGDRIRGDGPVADPDGVLLDDAQAQAVRMALRSPLAVLTGGPGCGKSFTIRTLVALAQAAGAHVVLAAPTGRAARRLAEVTGAPAMTVHRLLARARHHDPGTLFDDSDLLASADLVVVDEASMLDLSLAAKLAARIATGCHLLLVGDTDQLPSVGPGNVLRDVLDVPSIPRTRLGHVFRQAAGSAIVTNAHRIRVGERPLNAAGEFWFLPEEDPAKIPDLVLDIATRRLPTRYGIPAEQVQVLCPGRRTAVGTEELNPRLRDLLNPSRDGTAEHWTETGSFRVGDRVIQTRNNYDRGASGVFNGTTGIIAAIAPDDRQLFVRLEDGESVAYSFEEADELKHAYALTVHRAQGSEYPFVVIPLSTAGGPFMLQRSLIYTAVTRARQMVVVVGQERALELAVLSRSRRRLTWLASRATLLAPGKEPAQR